MKVIFSILFISLCSQAWSQKSPTCILSGTRIDLCTCMNMLRTLDGNFMDEISLENFVSYEEIITRSEERFETAALKKPKDSTASRNVHIVDTAFFIPQLDRYRRIWIYLPPSYSQTRKKYPVLYMQDGQNIFDNATSFSGEWGVDEAIDSMSAQYGEMIVVGIDNGGQKRMSEYSPFDTKYGKAEGDAYVDFLVQTLRPYINKHYRTRKCGKHNFIAGSSMGALISYYALLKYPRKFGGAGIFSPSFWIAPSLKEVDGSKAKKIKGKVYFFAGMQESETMVPDMLQIFEQLRKYSKAEMKTVIRAEGKHNEATWRAEFPGFYNYILSKDKN
jgi:predicted alpha/beta superfamily hydrolase